MGQYRDEQRANRVSSEKKWEVKLKGLINYYGGVCYAIRQINQIPDCIASHRVIGIPDYVMTELLLALAGKYPDLTFKKTERYDTFVIDWKTEQQATAFSPANDKGSPNNTVASGTR